MLALSDLSPSWVKRGDNDKAALIFKCPHCREVWLTCTFEQTPMRDQMWMFRRWGRMSGGQVVPCNQKQSWRRDGVDFAGLSVSPSVDASASGHWHGYIQNGVCN